MAVHISKSHNPARSDFCIEGGKTYVSVRLILRGFPLQTPGGEQFFIFADKGHFAH